MDRDTIGSSARNRVGYGRASRGMEMGDGVPDCDTGGSFGGGDGSGGYWFHDNRGQHLGSGRDHWGDPCGTR